jgi:hypothetical protein
MATSSGLYSIPEFVGRNVLKLAPDAFIAVNTEVGARFVAPVSSDNDSTGYKSLDVRGGVTSINVNAAVSPPGASRANIEIVAPIYKGLHEDYYFTLPNGTRRPIFQAMMEVKVYMKGYNLNSGNPIYYPVFWGFISNVSESYSGGTYSISLTCADLLSWWKYQKLSIIPAAVSSQFGAPSVDKFPTVFENMNPWQIIYNLMYETEWKSKNGRRYDFIYPKFSRIGSTANFGNLLNSKELVNEFFIGLAEDANSYWQRRFGSNRDSSPNAQDRMQMEMFGLLNEVDLDNSRIRSALSYDQGNRQYQQKSQIPELDVNFFLLSQVQPYGAFNLYDGGASGLEHTKLEIATEICEQTEMEFFLDTNGSAVFKPPFYNLDVTKNDQSTYVIKAKDVINFSDDINSDGICTFLEVYGPRYQFDPNLDSMGYHMDFDLIKKFGLRYQKLELRYGNNPDQLRLLAAAKMAKINGRAYSGSVSIPCRPEMRLGYPVYLSHIDAYYYVSGINHSFTYGSSATTTLSLEYRRDRVFSDGEVEGTKSGDNLKGYVYRYDLDGDPNKFLNTFGNTTVEDRERQKEDENESSNDPDVTSTMRENDDAKWSALSDGNVISGPKTTGFYKVSKANPNSGTSGSGSSVVSSNELVMMNLPSSANDRTGESIPYTDINGYRHIGAFPYGANLAFTNGESTPIDTSDPKAQAESTADSLTGAATSQSDSLSEKQGNANENIYSGKFGATTEPPDDDIVARESGPSNDNVQAIRAQSDERRRPAPPTSALNTNSIINDNTSLEKEADAATNAGIYA